MPAKIERLSPPLDTHDADDGSGLKVLDRCLGYRVGDKEYWVECGYGTDFASFPALARFIVRWNKTDDAAVIHDKPFSDGYIYDRYGRKQVVSLWEMNRVFRKIAQYGKSERFDSKTLNIWFSKDRANPAQAWLSWSGLMVGSWMPWRKRPQIDIEQANVEWPLKVNPLLCRDEQA